ncbi:Uncharacterized protein BM_BM407 [Brugia malayi]|uniref:Bm407 n=1 Tax=Brugia malayi TaxID=6279 RepID=A0A0K0JD15_BRUMA|nr:Uncharacterized protein BM_BM407 [Brugia malayi]CDP94578.1 Bm407 [Brugia malayi]VIO86752.1 Uncharacterized protein BM_BM407 [Brugia malayi]
MKLDLLHNRSRYLGVREMEEKQWYTCSSGVTPLIQFPNLYFTDNIILEVPVLIRWK